MKLIMDLSVVPLGVGASVSTYIAECEKIIDASGLKHSMHAYGTNIEGEWDEVMAVVRACHDKVHEMGAPRVTTTIKMGTRTDKDQSIDGKIRSVNEKMK